MVRRKGRFAHVLSLSIACAALAAGCKVGPNFEQPKLDMPISWAGPTTQPGSGDGEPVAANDATTRPATVPTSNPTTRASAATTQPTDISRWWATFDDAALDSLIARAVDANLDLRQAEARLRQARAARGVAASALWPNANLSGSYRRSGNGPGDLNNGGGGGGSGGSGSANRGSSSRDLYQAGLDASWEIDVFGGNRRAVEAADADIRSAVEDRRDVLISVIAEVALDYMDVRGFQRQIEIANRNLAAQRATLDVTRRLGGAGFVGKLDVAQSEAQVATTLSQIPQLQASLRQTIYALGVLLGREPGALLDELAAPAPYPKVPSEVPTGLPSDLLLRRPDVRRVAADLHAATARLGVATADLYPRFSLTGSFGTSGVRPSSLTNAANNFWSIGPSITWPLFTAGQVRSNIAVQRARVEEILAAYKSTVLTALSDVENALIAYDREQARRATLVDAVAANRRAVDLANALYVNGETDSLNLLTAQRALNSSEDALEQSDRQIRQNLIALYKALGGGW